LTGCIGYVDATAAGVVGGVVAGGVVAGGVVFVPGGVVVVVTGGVVVIVTGGVVVVGGVAGGQSDTEGSGWSLGVLATMTTERNWPSLNS
jgi:hypothetical protein